MQEAMVRNDLSSGHKVELVYIAVVKTWLASGATTIGDRVRYLEWLDDPRRVHRAGGRSD